MILENVKCEYKENGFYALYRADDSVIELSDAEVSSIYFAYRKNINLADLKITLDLLEETDGSYSIVYNKPIKLNEVQITLLKNKALPHYEEDLDNSEEWSCHARNALIDALDELKTEGLLNG